MIFPSMKIAGLLLFVTFFVSVSCQNEQREREARAKIAMESAGTYTRFRVNNFRHVQLNFEVGRVRVRVYQHSEPMIGIHESFQKYVNFEERGDSLFIYSIKPPSSVKTTSIRKNIVIYVPDLDSYDAAVSETSFVKFRTEKLNVKLDNDYFRLYNCGIADLNINTSDACNVVIDKQNLLLKAEITMNEKSILSFKAPAQKLTLNKLSLNNVLLANVLPENFKWIK